MPVLNEFPTVPPSTYRLAVVGEAPGQDEEIMGRPFVGASGRLLKAILGNCGIATSQVFFGNVCQHRPPENELSNLAWEGFEIQDGARKLLADLERFKPNAILLLGKAPLKLFRDDLMDGEKAPALGDVRGSIFWARGYKCIATFHPAYILRAYNDNAYFRLDVARAVRQSAFPELRTKVRSGLLRPTLNDALTYIADLKVNRRPFSTDIEGYPDAVGVTMLCLCPTDVEGIVIPFWLNGTHYWTEDEEVEIWRALADLYADERVPKDAHNAFYELFVLAWRHKIIVNNLDNDTMMLQWEHFPELERGLGVATSIWTEEPFYKDERLSDKPDIKLNYNFKDGACTREIATVAGSKLSHTPTSYAHYRFNINLIPAVNYIHLRGCRFDVARANALREETQREVDTLNAQIESALGREFNVKSNPDKQWLLYDHYGFEPLKRWGKKATEEILLHYWTKTKDPTLRLVIQCVRKRTRVSDINKLVPNNDGRIRTSLDLVGTNTGRVSSRGSMAMELYHTKRGEPYWENVGTNLQNVTKDLRVCFVPDDETYDFWQFDLSGADGWTVAADLAALGHSAMLDDYIAGIKPALVLYAMLQEHEAGRDPKTVNSMDRTALKALTKAIKQELDKLEGQKDAHGRPADWKYLCCKRVQHGSNYGMQPDKLSETIFGDSDGVIDLSPKDAGLYQFFYKLRYRTDNRNEAIRRELATKGYLVADCGIKRQFFAVRYGGKVEDSIVREAAAFKPQANTTWATNKALENLWYDPQNRTSRHTLFVEPLLQVHDALGGQYRQSYRPWAHEKLQSWFQNPMRISGISITIPAEGKYGTSWKDTKITIT